MNRKFWIVIILIAFFVGALGSILLGRFIIPYFAAATGWESLNKLVTNSPIIINRTNEVQLNEGVNLIDLTKQAGNITVSLYTTGANPSYLANGIVMTSDGLIFTSKAVLAGQTELKAVLYDGRTYKALVHAVDPKSDIAVLTIDEKNLSSASFNNAQDLEAGQRLLTIGVSNVPFDRIATQGYVISSVANNANQLWRTYSTEVLENSFETDAPVNNGLFIGSPMISMNGKVVGMVTGSSLQKIVVAENLQTALNSYLANNKIIRPRLGVTYFNISKTIATLKGLARPGVLVSKVDEGSPAVGKILANDLIFEVDGQNLENQNFEQIINRHLIGEIKFKLLRAGKETEAIVNMEATK